MPQKIAAALLKKVISYHSCSLLMLIRLEKDFTKNLPEELAAGKTTMKVRFNSNFSFLLGKRKSGWGEETEKTFVPQTFSYVPPHFTINEFEIWISKGHYFS